MRCRLLRVLAHLKSTLRVIKSGFLQTVVTALPPYRLGLQAMMQLAGVGQSLCVTSLSRQAGYSKHISENMARKRGGQSTLTSLFGGLVIRLAHQSAVLHQVILVTCRQLPFAHDAGETVEVVDEVLRSSHHLRGWNPLLTRCAFGPESPLGKAQIDYQRLVPRTEMGFDTWGLSFTWRNPLCSRRCRLCWSISPPAAPDSRCTSGTCCASDGPALWGWSGPRCVGCSPRTRGSLQETRSKPVGQLNQNTCAIAQEKLKSIAHL